MSDNKTCPQCGAALPPDAPEGVCPRCVLAFNLATQTRLTDAPADPDNVGRPKPEILLEAVRAAFPQLEDLEPVGRGGMGVVYKARQKSLDRLVALKLLAPERADDAGFAERFEREAKALAALNHPNIVTIHDFGFAPVVGRETSEGHEAEGKVAGEGGFYFLLMEFVDGVNLRQAMKAGKFTPEQALAIVPPVCEALQFAHERGIVHRDIKPENLLLDRDGRVKIADFGIARMMGETAGSRGEGRGAKAGEGKAAGASAATFASAAGTPQYMAPEQMDRPGHTDHRADIYSLGVVLYELLTGERPGDGFEPPSRKVQIDVRLDEIVLRALEAKPELRFATAAEFREEVETLTSAPARALQREGGGSGGRPGASMSPGVFQSTSAATVLFAVLVSGFTGFVALSALRVPAWFGLLLELAAVVAVAYSPVGRRCLNAWNAGRPSPAVLRTLAWLAFLVSLPLLGLGGFFSHALMGETGGWHPNPVEAFVVPFVWLGAFLLPVCGNLFYRGAERSTSLPAGATGALALMNALVAMLLFFGGLMLPVMGFQQRNEVARIQERIRQQRVVDHQKLRDAAQQAKADAVAALERWESETAELTDPKAKATRAARRGALARAADEATARAANAEVLLERAGRPTFPPPLPVSPFPVGLLAAFLGVSLLVRGRGRSDVEDGDAVPPPDPTLDCPVKMDEWLALLDAGDHEQSWDTAAPGLRRECPAEEWSARMKKERLPLGDVKSRRLVSMVNTVSGARYEGVYASAFEKLPQATETLIYTRQPDGKWQPFSYTVRPGKPRVCHDGTVIPSKSPGGFSIGMTVLFSLLAFLGLWLLVALLLVRGDRAADVELSSSNQYADVRLSDLRLDDNSFRFTGRFPASVCGQDADGSLQSWRRLAEVRSFPPSPVSR